MPTITEWTLAVILDVLHFGLVIAILYTLKRFYKHRYSQPLQKRSPLLVYLMNICCIFYLLYNITDNFAYIYGELEWNIEPILSGEEIGYPFIIKLVAITCYTLSIHGMGIMWIARSWIFYFNCKYGLEVQKSEWCMHLNDRYSDTLWFVKHRKDYGSNRVIYPIAITYYIILVLLQTFVLFVAADIWMIYDSASSLIELIILVIIWNKIPSFNDIFGIKKEMQWMFRVAGFILLLYIVYMVLWIMIGPNLWLRMLTQFVFGIMAGSFALILNGFIFHHPNYNYLISKTLEIRTLDALSHTLSLPTSEEKLPSSPIAVLENEHLIDGFAMHLTDEFSLELLLALIEFKQFHDLMTSDEQFMSNIQRIISGNSGDTRISQNILFRQFLTDELPKSRIVHENHRGDGEDGNHIKMYLGIARELFNKYVLDEAEFEVNLSHAHRQRIAKFIQKYNDLPSIISESEQLELFVLFNEASGELYHLLRASHDRYLTSNKQLLSPTDLEQGQ